MRAANVRNGWKVDIARWRDPAHRCAMRVMICLCLSALAVSGCQQSTPAMTDADYQKFKGSNPGMTAQCLEEVRYAGIDAWRSDDPACFEMTSARRWSGLWETGWEWTNFCPEPARECDWMAKRGIWLVFANDALREARPPEGTYRIEFVGRRTRVPGNFGHIAAYEHLMVVDRVISIKPIASEEHTSRESRSR